MKAISLFSGAMGLDLGLEQAGIEVVLAQDTDPRCCETVRINGRRVLEGDIQDFDPEDILKEAGMKREEPFLVCGGPPCQPFSTAGRQMGIADPRGSLFREFSRMVEGIRPRFFVMENVAGLANRKAWTEEGTVGQTVLDAVLAEFGRIGYRTVHGILNAVDYGVPQFRERLIVIGSRDGEDVFLPKPTHFQMHQNPAYRWRTLRDAIGGLEDVPSGCARLSESRLAVMMLVPEGGNWRDLPLNVQKDAMKGTLDSGGGRTGCFRRLSYSEPCPTLTTSPGQKTTMLFHPSRDRVLSVEEYARIQEFPQGWLIAGKTAERYRQLGNAVPVGLGRAVGQALVSLADGTALVSCRRDRKRKQ